jgi:hypothetical protein
MVVGGHLDVKSITTIEASCLSETMMLTNGGGCLVTKLSRRLAFRGRPRLRKVLGRLSGVMGKRTEEPICRNRIC